jgi:trans-2-enoyl-CoA reductase
MRAFKRRGCGERTVQGVSKRVGLADRERIYNRFRARFTPTNRTIGVFFADKAGTKRFFPGWNENSCFKKHMSLVHIPSTEFFSTGNI